MRFFADGPDIPLELLDARDKGDVVFLCGAGVSVPAGMPSFVQLAKMVADELGADDISASMPLDQLFGDLQKSYGIARVERLVTKFLRTRRKADLRKHQTILRLSSDMQGNPRLVTTNFDLLFEAAGKRLKTFVPPYLPDLDYAQKLEGLVYLHGRLDGSARPAESLRGLVLGIADMGRAYLADGWATRFMNQLISRYTVVLLGYSANDVPIRYLLEGLNARGSKARLFAFSEGQAGETQQKWWDRGVMAIPYSSGDNEHSALWRTLTAWARRAESIDRWHADTIELARVGPRNLEPHERGRVASMALTVTGASALADANPPIPAEWLCVFDSLIRYGRVQNGWRDRQEDFDPLAIYRLDGDPARPEGTNGREQVIGINVLEPQSHDDHRANFTRLAGRIARRAEPLPARLHHLGRWIAASAGDPVSIWWASHHHQLHPAIEDLINWRLRQQQDIDATVRQSWRLYFEASQHDAHPEHRDFYDLLGVIKQDGWRGSTLRQLRKVMEPYLKVTPTRFHPGPPIGEQELRLGRIMNADVEFVHRSEQLSLPAERLSWFVACLRDCLLHAASIKKDLEVDTHSRTPTLHHEDKPGTVHLDDEDSFFLWFAELFEKLVSENPAAAHRELSQWPIDEPSYFAKLSVWAWMFPSAMPATEAAEAIAGLSDVVFWRENHQRELLWTIRARWPEFTDPERATIEARTVSGPHKWANEEEDEYRVRKARWAAVRIGWLIHNGLTISKITEDAVALLRGSDPEWRPSWDEHADQSHDSRSGWVKLDTDATSLMDAPLNDVVARIDAIERRPAGGFVERNPFLGLYKTRPARALAVLTLESRKGNYPERLWRTIFSDDMPDRQRYRWLVARRLANLPKETIVSLAHSACRWLQNRMPEFYQRRPDEALAVWDTVFASLVAAGNEATSSAMGDLSTGGVKQRRSRRTFGHAINGPVGELTEALIQTLVQTKPAKPSSIPRALRDRINATLQAPGEGADHAASMIFIHLKWLFWLDPNWTKSSLLPMLKHSHRLSEPAWNGFLYDNRLPQANLFNLIKADYLEAFAVSETWRWEDQAAARLSQFLVVATAGTGKKILTSAEGRDALRAANDDLRTAAVRQLGAMIKGAADWHARGTTFVEKVWPQEVRFQTSATSLAFADIAMDTEAAFPDAVKRISAYLQPVEQLDSVIFQLTHVDEKRSKSLAQRYPMDSVRLVDLLTPDKARYVPYNLREFLQSTSELEPDLRHSQSWRRLNELSTTS
ncbi:SIR2 family protein [Hyphomicrobium sp. NDB2Meth4]|uniref:SIR2 family protein n=1 Tax=Hyphomicrobium sp. NDB2Meth4 TaxID=1892846 RepID=UPI000930BA19|nr:SIR2 family protein [Hyphomicrobium sp. NDB2Meth4]